MRPWTSLAVVLLGLEPITAAAQRPPTIDEEHEYACEAGDLPSCTVLGVIYETGAVGERDPARALELYERGCDFDILPACARLEIAPDPESPAPDLEEGFRRMGQVADGRTGEPLPGAIVTVAELGLRVVADQRGHVDLGTLPPGRYEITARRGDYLTVDGELPVPWDRQFLLLMERTSPPGEYETVGRIVGRVTDPSGAPLPGVAVVLPGESTLRAVTNVDGRFAIEQLDPGVFELELTHLGYQQRTTTVRVEAGVTMEVYAELAMEPIPLEPIEVTVGSAYLQRNGFYRRVAQNGGKTITRAEIQRFEPMATADIFQRIPGVTAMTGRSGTRLYTSRARFVDGAPCRLRTVVDGLMVDDYDPNYIRPEDLEAVEVYEGARIPVEYRNMWEMDGTMTCGVVLFWTRRFQ